MCVYLKTNLIVEKNIMVALLKLRYIILYIFFFRGGGSEYHNNNLKIYQYLNIVEDLYCSETSVRAVYAVNHEIYKYCFNFNTLFRKKKNSIIHSSNDFNRYSGVLWYYLCTYT